jgi:hypothetical protein
LSGKRKSTVSHEVEATGTSCPPIAELYLPEPPTVARAAFALVTGRKKLVPVAGRKKLTPVAGRKKLITGWICSP